MHINSLSTHGIVDFQSWKVPKRDLLVQPPHFTNDEYEAYGG